MECPNCKLICPPDTVRCDCGYDFPTSEMKESCLSQEEQFSRRIERAARLTPLNIIFSLFRLNGLTNKALHYARAKLWRRE
jgi:hypothetical protein